MGTNPINVIAEGALSGAGRGKMMRQVFIREDISSKEAKLMDLLSMGRGWAEIAREFGYTTAKAAANVGDRVFDKLLTPEDQQVLVEAGMKKRPGNLAITATCRPYVSPATCEPVAKLSGI